MNDPEVSVILPAFNSERWLAAAMGSVLDQTFQDFELIVVDDGSTDGTQEVASSFPDPRVSCIQQTNRGLSAARNTGIRAAKGVYVALLDADDLFKPTKLSRQVAAFEGESELSVVTCGFELIDECGEAFGDRLHWREHPNLDLSTLLFWNPLLPSTLLIRREVFEEVGLFDETLGRYEDWEFAVRLGLGGARIEYVREILLSYRRHNTNISSDTDLVTVATSDAERFMNRVFRRADLPSEIRSLKQRVFGNLHLDAAARAYATGLNVQGRQSLEEAIGRDPSLVDGNPPKWVTAICGHALGTLVDNPSDYLKSVASNLPNGEPFQSWNESRIRAHLEAARAYDFFRQGSRFRARCAAFRALMKDANLMRNRGLWAVALKP